MYCPPYLHDNSSKHKSLDELKRYWLSIIENTRACGLKYKIVFTGGEVTGNRAFLPFLRWLRDEFKEQIGLVILTTNGSATYSYYMKLYEVADNIAFSLHSEHVNEQKFFDTIIKLHQTIGKDKFLHVLVMNEFWNQDRIKLYQKLLDEHKISYNVNDIDYSKQTRTIPIMKGKLNLANSESRVL